jgi:hypothetical protein
MSTLWDMLTTHLTAMEAALDSQPKIKVEGMPRPLRAAKGNVSKNPRQNRPMKIAQNAGNHSSSVRVNTVRLRGAVGFRSVGILGKGRKRLQPVLCGDTLQVFMTVVAGERTAS